MFYILKDFIPQEVPHADRPTWIQAECIVLHGTVHYFIHAMGFPKGTAPVLERIPQVYKMMTHNGICCQEESFWKELFAVRSSHGDWYKNIQEHFHVKETELLTRWPTQLLPQIAVFWPDWCLQTPAGIFHFKPYFAFEDYIQLSVQMGRAHFVDPEGMIFLTQTQTCFKTKSYIDLDLKAIGPDPKTGAYIFHDAQNPKHPPREYHVAVVPPDLTIKPHVIYSGLCYSNDGLPTQTSPVTVFQVHIVRDLFKERNDKEQANGRAGCEATRWAKNAAFFLKQTTWKTHPLLRTHRPWSLTVAEKHQLQWVCQGMLTPHQYGTLTSLLLSRECFPGLLAPKDTANTTIATSMNNAMTTTTTTTTTTATTTTTTSTTTVTSTTTTTIPYMEPLTQPLLYYQQGALKQDNRLTRNGWQQWWHHFDRYTTQRTCTARQVHQALQIPDYQLATDLFQYGIQAVPPEVQMKSSSSSLLVTPAAQEASSSYHGAGATYSLSAMFLDDEAKPLYLKRCQDLYRTYQKPEKRKGLIHLSLAKQLMSLHVQLWPLYLAPPVVAELRIYESICVAEGVYTWQFFSAETREALSLASFVIHGEPQSLSVEPLFHEASQLERFTSFWDTLRVICVEQGWIQQQHMSMTPCSSLAPSYVSLRHNAFAAFQQSLLGRYAARRLRNSSTHHLSSSTMVLHKALNAPLKFWPQPIFWCFAPTQLLQFVVPGQPLCLQQGRMAIQSSIWQCGCGGGKTNVLVGSAFFDHLWSPVRRQIVYLVPANLMGVTRMEIQRYFAPANAVALYDTDAGQTLTKTHAAILLVSNHATSLQRLSQELLQLNHNTQAPSLLLLCDEASTLTGRESLKELEKIMEHGRRHRLDYKLLMTTGDPIPTVLQKTFFPLLTTPTVISRRRRSPLDTTLEHVMLLCLPSSKPWRQFVQQKRQQKLNPKLHKAFDNVMERYDPMKLLWLHLLYYENDPMVHTENTAFFTLHRRPDQVTLIQHPRKDVVEAFALQKPAQEYGDYLLTSYVSHVLQEAIAQQVQRQPGATVFCCQVGSMGLNWDVVEGQDRRRPLTIIRLDVETGQDSTQLAGRSRSPSSVFVDVVTSPLPVTHPYWQQEHSTITQMPLAWKPPHTDSSLSTSSGDDNMYATQTVPELIEDFKQQAMGMKIATSQKQHKQTKTSTRVQNQMPDNTEPLRVHADLHWRLPSFMTTAHTYARHVHIRHLQQWHPALYEVLLRRAKLSDPLYKRYYTLCSQMAIQELQAQLMEEEKETDEEDEEEEDEEEEDEEDQPTEPASRSLKKRRLLTSCTK
jgi:hypothetical protein